MVELLDELNNGFRFKCQRCGRCCKGKGEGFVFLFGNEKEKICDSLKVTDKQFMEKYAEEIEAEYRIFDDSLIPTQKKIFLPSVVLKQDDNDGECVFLSDERCKIYAERPNQCRTWPTWRVVMTNRRGFNNAKKKCPGIDAKDGRLITKEEILSNINREIQIERNFIKLRRNSN